VSAWDWVRTSAGLLLPRMYAEAALWYPCCEGCVDGSDCFDGTLSGSQLQVTIPDEWTNGTCSNCDFSGTYYLDYYGTWLTGGVAVMWDYLEAARTCNCNGTDNVYFYLRFWLLCSVTYPRKCHAAADVGYESTRDWVCGVGTGRECSYFWYTKDDLALPLTSWTLDYNSEGHSCAAVCNDNTLSDLTFSKV
jgi:hypothetical protein